MDKFYLITTVEYGLGCNIISFDKEAELLNHINSLTEREYVESIIHGKEIEIEPQEIIKEWKVKI